MKRLALLTALCLSTQAQAEEISVQPEGLSPAVLISNPPPQVTSSSFRQPVKSPSSTQVNKSLPASVEVTRDEAGRIKLDGKAFPERHPMFEKRVAKPVKTIARPFLILDRKSGFHKLRHITSDAIIVGGAKFKPYEPAAGAVITANQIINLVAPKR